MGQKPVLTPRDEVNAAPKEARAALIQAMTKREPQPQRSSTYDYEAAARHGITPQPYAHETELDPATGQPYLHMDSRFKMDHDPRRFLRSELGIFDTKYSQIVPPAQFNKIATPEQKQTLVTAEVLPAAETQGYLNEARKNPLEQPIPGTQRLRKEQEEEDYQAGAKAVMGAQ